jgi:hypothetical protein
VVEIEERALRPFEEDSFAPFERPIDEERGVGHVWPQPLGEQKMRRDDLFDVERLELVHAFQPDVLLGDGELELLAKDLRVEQVLDTNPDSRGLVGVRGPDAAPRGADLQPPEPTLARSVERDVPGHDHVRVPGYEEQAGRLVTARLEIVELPD